ncbi:zinc finger CCCH domain-containing protein 64 [Andrographis paniculata]|uniref:zinc finger CCCH domain-containing protein 64 n=1 Tax=Andrographis paniculata TaxID=175694 RepID=UPI0021E91A0D|nr:zinc finger CCCH domain-containing protein 64 [Andrographis paniculata]XP_051114304.1 zinc finger CCCH domain-containing protein 64 [Andrographis paniculata]
MAAPRILLAGDAVGRLNQLFKRVASVNKSAGPFDALLCVGQFFPDTSEQLEEFNDYIEGRSKVPIPTYFIGDYGVGAPKILSVVAKKSANLGFKMDGLEVFENLYWLRGSGKFTLHGLSVAYISGRHLSVSQQFGVYSQDDVDSLRALTDEPGIVDIFLTNEWPKGVTNGANPSSIPSGILDSPTGDSTISELVVEIKPRYHIAGSVGLYYDREPYANAGAVHVTRFIALAPVGNKVKQKFIHALSPTPASKMSAAEICTKPLNTTSSPYALAEQDESGNGSVKRSADSTSDSQYWRYDVTQKRQKHGDGHGDRLCFKYVSSGSCPRGEKCHFRHDEDAREQSIRGVCFEFLNKGKCERGTDCKFKHSLQEEGQGVSNRRSGSGRSNRSKECWFCLSSPSLESHLIISIGEYCYCALAKGPLVEDHVLIIPIEHLPNSLSLPPECEKDLFRLQSSLKAFFKGQGKEVVFFEWVSKRGTHSNVQAVPIPSSRASSVGQIFNLAAKKLGFTFETLQNDSSSEWRKTLQTHVDRNQSLFYVEVPGGTILLHIVDDNEKFPAQFGREVMAGLLNMPDKADWKNCQMSKEDETKMAASFKSQFEEYDPNN